MNSELQRGNPTPPISLGQLTDSYVCMLSDQQLSQVYYTTAQEHCALPGQLYVQLPTLC